MTTDVIPGATVTPAVARALIDQARGRGFQHGVLGLRARPAATRPASFTHRDQPVRIVPAASALAVREAIRQADPDGWLVVVTDRSDDDLGPGLIAQFVWQRLRHPDPWQAVRQRFGAHGIDAKLLSTPRAREVAAGLLELAPADGWPPAPAGVLTREHALACVARGELGLPEGPVDLIAVLQWSTGRGLAGTIARLRARAGEATVDAVLGWVADAAGEAAPLVAALLRSGTPTDLVPLGVVLDCLLRSPARTDAEIALARLEHRWGSVDRGALRAAARLSTVVVTGLLGGRSTVEEARQLLTRADELLAEAQAQPLAGASRLLRTGLTARLRTLAEALRPAADADPVALEAAWAQVADHELSADDPRVTAARAGVRLARWLRTPDDQAAGTLAGLATRQLAVDAWVDSAVNDADSGVDDAVVAAALERVLGDVQRRRDAHDLAFAALLAREGCGDPVDGLIGLERVLPEVVVPLARDYPTLLLVLDGLSTGVATELLARATLDHALVECLLPGASARTPALAVLPTVTDVSRASLLSGRLATGQQDYEGKAFAECVRAHGLGEPFLDHKKGLDTSRQGFELADGVRLAIADIERYRLVGCVLNTIDDSLDRADPGGTDWRTDTVKHLAALLRAAEAAGRLIVLTSDHGHVIERRRGTQRSGGLGGRFRAASGQVEADEVLVSGPRVLTADHRAILAVNERLRYGPLKAGYHGGAAPAEAVVPLVLLAPANLKHTLAAAPLPEPAWWDDPALVGEPPAADSSAVAPTVAPEAKPEAPQPDLFTEPAPTSTTDGTGAALLASATYRSQKTLVGRLGVTDAAIGTLVDALASAPDRRLAAGRVAVALGVPANRVGLVMSQVAKLLNVEGYPVVSTDPATQAVTLDTALLAEQYGVQG